MLGEIMALTGLQIQKLLPKTNCKECGSNTCLAFAMKLASKKAELSLCPYASDEAIQVLGAASEPPVRAVSLGKEGAVKLGEETVLYRHEKTFVNQTALAVKVHDDDPEKKLNETLVAVREYVLDRVGETIPVDMVAVENRSGEKSTFVDAAKLALKMSGKPLALIGSNADNLIAAAEAISGTGALLMSADASSADKLREVAAAHGHALAVTGETLDDITATTAKLKDNGFNNIVVQFASEGVSEEYQVNSVARRAALKDNVKPLGYPFVHVVKEGDMLDGTVEAVTEICKYGGVCILPEFEPAQMSALMTLRLNIYTDPQKPIQVEPKVYPVGEPTEDSPMFVTTNFSLTYFMVSGEIENSGMSAWLVVPECEGMSVLTAWAAGKFNGMSVGKFVKESGIEDRVKNRDIVIPGYVAQISGDLEESLPGWNVLVGPQEAGDIESFVKARFV